MLQVCCPCSTGHLWNSDWLAPSSSRSSCSLFQATGVPLQWYLNDHLVSVFASTIHMFCSQGSVLPLRDFDLGLNWPSWQYRFRSCWESTSCSDCSGCLFGLRRSSAPDSSFLGLTSIDFVSPSMNVAATFKTLLDSHLNLLFGPYSNYLCLESSYSIIECSCYALESDARFSS